MESNSVDSTPGTGRSDSDWSESNSFGGGSSHKIWLNRISTRWTAVNNPTLFVRRYGRAIRKYIALAK